jgi:antitoxin component of MazEF toxin-antitoxin module
MGLEADCQVRFGRKTSPGRAHLDASELQFRGAALLAIPLEDVKTVEAKKGELHVAWSGGSVAFALGSQATAEKWALKIRYPRSLMDKLGVKPNSRVSVLGEFDKSLRTDLRARASDVTEGKASKDSDIIMVAMTKQSDLAKLEALRSAIKPNGAIWVIWPKGRKEFREGDVRAFGPGVGLVDVKVVRISDALSALKLVIPVAQR